MQDCIIKDEAELLEYLKQNNFEKYFNHLTKKLKNKKIVIYGSGSLFMTVKKHYDLSKLNIIAVADRRFEDNERPDDFLGYKVCSRDEIKDLKPDCVLVATKLYMDIIEGLYFYDLKNTKIKIKPLVERPFWTVMKEIWK